MVFDFVVVDDVDVMVEWVGFGYYVWVCNLLKCVCVIVIDYDGMFFEIYD